MNKLEQSILLRIYMRLLRRYGEAAMERRLRGTWLTEAAQKRVLEGRRGVRH